VRPERSSQSLLTLGVPRVHAPAMLYHRPMLNHYVTLGRSGLRVSPLCLGAMTFGLDWGWGSDPDSSKAIIDAYMDRGGNFIDTANIYTKGHSEAIIGEHLGTNPSKRQRAVIATKFLGNLYSGDPNGGGAGRKAIHQQLDNSLRRMKTDYVDLYWMHWSDPFTPIDETMRTLDDLVRAGKVRYIGFSDTPAWRVVQAQMLAEFKHWTPLCCLQIEYSLVERTVEGDLMPMARELNLGVTPWSPLKGGVLTGKYTRANKDSVEPGRGAWVKNHFNDRVFNIVDAIVEIARQCKRTSHGPVTPAQVALAWVQGKPGVASSIIGARTMEQLHDNVAALEVQLSPEQMARLDEVSKPTLAFPHEFLKFTVNNTQGGATVNGRPSEPWALAPKDDKERW
jgi:aryl-alcohol dehydrogenase-like predicted oxidoreductase